MNLPTTATDMTKPASMEDKLKALAAFATLPTQQSFSPEQDEINDRARMQALEGVTRYALGEAVKAILKGSLGHTFFPSPVELRLACDQAQRPVDDLARRVYLTKEQQHERREYERFQASKTPEAKARVAALVAKFHAGCQSAKSEDQEAERAEIRARYGITDEALASIPDQTVPSNFKRLA